MYSVQLDPMTVALWLMAIWVVGASLVLVAVGIALAFDVMGIRGFALKVLADVRGGKPTVPEVEPVTTAVKPRPTMSSAWHSSPPRNGAGSV